MLWITAGVGCTPFMAFAAGLSKSAASAVPQVTMLYSARGEELTSIGALLQKLPAISELQLFDTAQGKRMTADDLAHVSGLKERAVYICCPDAFMKAAVQWCIAAGIDAKDVHTESFKF